MLKHLECGGRNHRFSKRLVSTGDLRFKPCVGFRAFLKSGNSGCRSPDVARQAVEGDARVFRSCSENGREFVNRQQRLFSEQELSQQDGRDWREHQAGSEVTGGDEEVVRMGDTSEIRQAIR